MPPNPILFGRRLELEQLAAAEEDFELVRAVYVKAAIEGRGARTRTLTELLRLEEPGRAQLVANGLGVSRGTLWRWRTGRSGASPALRRSLERMALRAYVSTPTTTARGRTKLNRIGRLGIWRSQFKGSLHVEHMGRVRDGSRPAEERTNITAYAFHLDPDLEIFEAFVNDAKGGRWLSAGGLFETSWFIAYFAGEWDGLMIYLKPKWTEITALTMDVGRTA